MWLVFILLGAIVVAGVSLLAVGKLGQLPESVPDRAPVLPPELQTGPITAEALRNAKLPMGFRGYRMDVVDELLELIARDLPQASERMTPPESGSPASDSHQ